MVKFRPLTFKYKYKNFLIRQKNFKNKTQLNSARIPLLLGLGSRTKPLAAFKVASFSGARIKPQLSEFMLVTEQDFNLQFFYQACSTTFALKHELFALKNHHVLHSFILQDSTLSTTKLSNLSGNKTNSFNLFFSVNLTLIILFSLRQLNPNKYLMLRSSKALIGAENILLVGRKARALKASLVHIRGLKHIFKKIQLRASLSGSIEFFSHSLLKIWASRKNFTQNILNLSEPKLLYHVRRIEDKLEFGGQPEDRARLDRYVGSLLRFFQFKSSSQRLFSLKNIVRKTKHRRRSRWGIFSRKYVKGKRHLDRLTPREKFVSALKFNELSQNINENEKN